MHDLGAAPASEGPPGGVGWRASGGVGVLRVQPQKEGRVPTVEGSFVKGGWRDHSAVATMERHTQTQSYACSFLSDTRRQPGQRQHGLQCLSEDGRKKPEISDRTHRTVRPPVARIIDRSGCWLAQVGIRELQLLQSNSSCSSFTLTSTYSSSSSCLPANEHLLFINAGLARSPRVGTPPRLLFH